MSESHIAPADDRADFNKRTRDEEDDFREVLRNDNGRKVDSNLPSKESAKNKIDDPVFRRSGSLSGDAVDNVKSLSRKAPATPSPGKMQSIAKQERKQKRIFFLQSMQRKKMEGENECGDQLMVSYAPTGAVSKAVPAGGNIRAGGVGYASSENGRVRNGLSKKAIPPLPVESAAAESAHSRIGNDDLGQLFNQFQSSSFSARERRETLPVDKSVVKYERKLATAPDVAKSRNSRFPSLRGSGKVPGSI